MSSTSFSLCKAAASEVTEIGILEAASFPADEAATPDKIAARIAEAGEFFYTYRSADFNKLIGFVNGTCILSPKIHHESMSHHEPCGTTLVIHSVTIDSAYRRQGLGSSMLKAYIAKIVNVESVNNVLLLSKAAMLTFYVNCGFSLVGASDVAHGQDTWFEMKLDLCDLRTVEQIQVDAFAPVAFSGNPAAVIFQHRDPEWMQNVAMENNLAETSFLETVPNMPARYVLRWFTPAVEVELCGHATLAAAHALYETKRVEPLQLITFQTVFSGELTAQGKPDGTIELNFPATQVTKKELSAELLLSLQTALSLKDADIVEIGSSIYDLVVEVTRDAFARLADTAINYTQLAEQGGRGVLVTCVGGARAAAVVLDTSTAPKAGRAPRADIVNDTKYDFLSRGFFPRYGINEDPVTGSAHCALCPYWAHKLLTATPEGQGQSLVGYQASARGGVVKVTLCGDRVKLAGPCVTTMRTKVTV